MYSYLLVPLPLWVLDIVLLAYMHLLCARTKFTVMCAHVIEKSEACRSGSQLVQLARRRLAM